MSYAEQQQPVNTLQVYTQQPAAQQHSAIQPYYGEMLPVLPQPPQPPYMADYRQQSQQRQQSVNKLALVLLGFVLGAAVGGGFLFLLGLAIAPKNPAPIINNPAPNITNPDCVIFCR